MVTDYVGISTKQTPLGRHRAMQPQTHEWFTNWLGLHNIWQRVPIIPPSRVVCERGSSKQNLIKNHLQASLKSKTLDAFDVDFIDT